MNISQFTSTYRTKLILDVYKKWIRAGAKVIDIGCGTGVVGKILQDDLSIKITGADVKNYLIYKIAFVEIKKGRIPAKNKSYEVALLNDVLHHVNREDQVDIIEEANRVAKSILVFEFEPTLIGKATDIILNEFHYGDLNVPLSQRSMNEWQTLFKSMGYQYETVKLKRPFWYPFSHFAFKLVKK